MQWATQVAKNLGKATSAELVEVRNITWKTAPSRSKVGTKDLAGILRRRSLVRLLLLVTASVPSYPHGQLMSAGSAYQILRLREFVCSDVIPDASFYPATGNISLWRLVTNAT